MPNTVARRRHQPEDFQRRRPQAAEVDHFRPEAAVDHGPDRPHRRPVSAPRPRSSATSTISPGCGTRSARRTLASSAPALIYRDSDLIKRAIRDLYHREIDEVVVEGDEGYKAARGFMKLLMPSHVRRVKQYVDPMPMFQRYGVEDQLTAMYQPVVQLKSGGYLVINPTEALVSIDINSGRSTREHNIEQTAFATNLEAAHEIARQLRLRDMAGLVVIDFIDMEQSSHVRKVEKAMKEALKNDRARIQVGRISGFGLMEMSRQRLRTGVLEASTKACPHCEGTGLMRTASSAGLSALRIIEDEAARGRGDRITLRAGERSGDLRAQQEARRAGRDRGPLRRHGRDRDRRELRGRADDGRKLRPAAAAEGTPGRRSRSSRKRKNIFPRTKRRKRPRRPRRPKPTTRERGSEDEGDAARAPPSPSPWWPRPPPRGRSRTRRSGGAARNRRRGTRSRAAWRRGRGRAAATDEAKPRRGAVAVAAGVAAGSRRKPRRSGDRARKRRWPTCRSPRSRSSRGRAGSGGSPRPAAARAPARRSRKPPKPRRRARWSRSSAPSRKPRAEPSLPRPPRGREAPSARAARQEEGRRCPGRAQARGSEGPRHARSRATRTSPASHAVAGGSGPSAKRGG